MKGSTPSPDDLSQHPELAVLTTLSSNLDMADFALLATYPESLGVEAETCSHTESEAYANAILYQIDSLRAMVACYFESVHRLNNPPWRESADPGGDLPF